MTILKKISWFTFFVFPLILCAQYTSNDLINWETGRKLNWGNYNGNPDPASDAAASTATYLGVEYSFSNNSPETNHGDVLKQIISWLMNRDILILRRFLPVN